MANGHLELTYTDLEYRLFKFDSNYLHNFRTGVRKRYLFNLFVYCAHFRDSFYSTRFLRSEFKVKVRSFVSTVQEAVLDVTKKVLIGSKMCCLWRISSVKLVYPEFLHLDDTL